MQQTVRVSVVFCTFIHVCGLSGFLSPELQVGHLGSGGQKSQGSMGLGTEKEAIKGWRVAVRTAVVLSR